MDISVIYNRRNQTSLLLLGLISLAMILLIFRFYWSSSFTYLSLTWNLFLASVPFVISRTIKHLDQNLSLALLIPLMGLWLLFFPNSPYILTDLFHLATRSGMPKWFDLLMLLSFAWTGLVMGIFSLMDIQSVVTRRYSEILAWFCSVVFIVLGSFGIYLGRYLRWNSWDIVTTPQPLIRDIYHIVVDPLNHPGTVGITLVFSAFLTLVYMTFFYLKNGGEKTH